MFVERSATRTHLVRIVFVLVGLLPFIALAAWAVLRHSDGHLHALRREGEQMLGLPLHIGSVEHVRPGLLRLRSCTVRSSSGSALLVLPTMEVDLSADEIRLMVPQLTCNSRATAALAEIARAWLREPARFSRSWVIDVRDFHWSANGVEGDEQALAVPADNQSDSQLLGLHIECVAAGDTRAVRVRCNPPSVDEVRVRLTLPTKTLPPLSSDENSPVANSPAGDPLPEGSSAGRYEISGLIEKPLPVTILATLATLAGSPLEESLSVLGTAAEAYGTIEAIYENRQWSGLARGRIDRVDLAACTAQLPYHASGEGCLTIPQLAWNANRLRMCQLDLVAESGQISQGLLNACTVALGCRAGAAYQPLLPKNNRRFDDLACNVRIDSSGLVVAAPLGRAGSLLRAQGLSLLTEPENRIASERLAWLASPIDTVAVPASAASAWLISVLPLSDRPATDASSSAVESRRLPPNQAKRPSSRDEF